VATYFRNAWQLSSEIRTTPSSQTPDAELQEVVARWFGIPRQLRDAILTIIRSVPSTSRAKTKRKTDSNR
jgi:hypothetical protein